jgi:hypothetical protein
MIDARWITVCLFSFLYQRESGVTRYSKLTNQELAALPSARHDSTFPLRCILVISLLLERVISHLYSVLPFNSSSAITYKKLVENHYARKHFAKSAENA